MARGAAHRRMRVDRRRHRVGWRSGLFALGLLLVVEGCDRGGPPPLAGDSVEGLVRQHAEAWEKGDTALLRRIIHENAVLAHPGLRTGRAIWVGELDAFSRTHTNTRVYIHELIVDGDRFAVEWQFATTELESGTRTAVSDAIVGRVRGGQIILWKEYLDGRIPGLQRAGELRLDEGEAPFPWPSER
jgi:ketosteroid isomerase-like protein